VPEDQIPPIRRFNWLGPGYLETMNTPLIAGRPITLADIEDRADVVMISEGMTREYWERPADAVGQRLRLPTLGALSGESVWREIIGVVGDVREDGIAQEAATTVYWPLVTRAFWDSEIFAQRSMAYAIRTQRIRDAAFLDEVRRVIWETNPNLPLANVQTMEAIVSRSMSRTSFTLVMLAIAAGVALVLGAVGIYGVTSYVVSQRTREIGVRMALGAQRGDVSRMVVVQGLALTGVGVAVGLAAAFLLTRAMSAILFGVSPVDPLTYGAVAGALTTVAVLASYLPARRAASVDPAVALKFD
jgi:predicted permease